MRRPSRPSFRRDRSASIALTFALALPVLIGAAAFATDLGSAYLERRDLQAATDAAALAVVSHPDQARDLARTMLAANGFEGVSFDVEFGRFVPEAESYSEGQMLVGQGFDVVRVSASTAMKPVFAPIFRIHRIDVAASSQAALQPTIALSSGSRLASVRPAFVNDLLTPILGVRLDLNLVDYASLLQAKIGLGDLLKRIAGPKTGRLVGDAVRETLTAASIFQQLSVQMDLDGQPVAASVLRKIGQRSLGITAKVALGDIIDIDPSLNGLALDYPGPDLAAKISVLDLMSAVIGQKGIGNTVGLTLPIPGVASLDIELAIGEGLQSVKPISIARARPVITTDQIRLRARVATVGALDLVNVGLNVPLEVVAAGGRAEVVSATCSADPAKRSVKLSVQPGVAKLAIGTWSGPLSSANVHDKLPPASLISALAVKVQGQGYVAARQVAPIEVVFTGSEIERGVVKTVKTRTIAESLVSSLLSETEIVVQVGIIGIPLGGLTKSVAGILSGLVKPLDDVLQAVSAVAGVGLGEMDVRVDDVVCGQPRIVG